MPPCPVPKPNRPNRELKPRSANAQRATRHRSGGVVPRSVPWVGGRCGPSALTPQERTTPTLDPINHKEEEALAPACKASGARDLAGRPSPSSAEHTRAVIRRYRTCGRYQISNSRDESNRDPLPLRRTNVHHSFRERAGPWGPQCSLTYTTAASTLPSCARRPQRTSASGARLGSSPRSAAAAPASHRGWHTPGPRPQRSRGVLVSRGP